MTFADWLYNEQQLVDNSFSIIDRALDNLEQQSHVPYPQEHFYKIVNRLTNVIRTELEKLKQNQRQPRIYSKTREAIKRDIIMPNLDNPQEIHNQIKSQYPNVTDVQIEKMIKEVEKYKKSIEPYFLNQQ